jgi:hypothetical protein
MNGGSASVRLANDNNDSRGREQSIELARSSCRLFSNAVNAWLACLLSLLYCRSLCSRVEVARLASIRMVTYLATSRITRQAIGQTMRRLALAFRVRSIGQTGVSMLRQAPRADWPTEN